MTHILIYTDANRYFGTEQNNHILGEAFHNAGFKVSFAQPAASHHLIQLRQALGIKHIWLNEDDSEPRVSEILAQVAPDLIVFSDHGPVSNLVAKQIALKKKVPYLIVSHSADPKLARDDGFDANELQKIYLGAETVISTSQANIDLLNGKFGLPLDRGVVVYPGRPAEFFTEPDLEVRKAIRQSLDIPENHLMCLTVASLHPRKGVQYLHDAINHLQGAKKLDRLHFVWVGEGDYETGQISRFQSVLPQTDMAGLMDASDLFVYPVEYAGSPLVLLEAMAKRLPIIATAVGGVPEIVDETGFLLPDPIWRPIGPVLANTIHWMDQSEQLRTEVGEAGNKRAVQYFKAETMANNYLSLVTMVLKRLANKKAAQPGIYPTVQLQDSTELNR